MSTKSSVIAPVYIGFAVADGCLNRLAVESGVATMLVIIAAAAITGTPFSHASYAWNGVHGD